MRAWMISLTIICFCFAMSMLANVEQQYYDNTTTWLFGAEMEYDQLPSWDDDIFSDYSRTNFNATLHEQTDNNPQPEELSSVGTLIDAAVWLAKGVRFFIDVLIMSSLGFFDFITKLGTAHDIVPSYIAGPIAVLVNITHLFAVWQAITGRNLLAGA